MTGPWFQRVYNATWGTVSIFFCGAAIGVPMLARLTDFGPVEGVGGFLRLLEAQVFNGSVPEGGVHLTWVHVAAFAWM